MLSTSILHKHLNINLIIVRINFAKLYKNLHGQSFHQMWEP